MTNLIVIQLLLVWVGVIPFVEERQSDDRVYDKWMDARTSDGVQTFYRWLKSPEGIPSRERRGELDVQCGYKEVVKIISGTQYTSQWMSGIEESRMIGLPVNNEWYTYTIFSIPWPFNKRDLVSLNRITHDPVPESTIIDILCRDSYLPVKPDLVRLTDYKARWKITKISDSKTHITFTAESSTPPAFPRYIQDPVIEKIFHNNLVRLKKLLEGKPL